MPVLKIVVAEDDPAIAELVRHHLRGEGFDVLTVGDGSAALRALRERADIAVVDVGLPVIDGLDVVRTLRREHRDVPVVLLTARVDEIDRVVGLEVGADDYICKPFSPRELVARVKAVARRAAQPYEQHPAVLQFGRLEIDEAAHEVRIDGVDAELKPREYSLLLVLAANAGVALSRRTLIERAWGFDFEGDERTVDVHMRRLRIKIQERRLPPILQTVHGFGYRFSRP
jgi:two-component system alkaline phosphatase synthesis response regulator PhoP